MKLTEQIVTELGGALERLQALGEAKIFTTEQAAEKRGLEAFVQRALSEHAQELLGAWLTVQKQYVPLVRGFAFLMMNATNLLQPPPPATSATEEKKEPSNGTA